MSSRTLSEEDRQKTEKVSAVQKIYRSNTAEKLITALKGSREERSILIRDPNRLVATAVLGSPRITEAEIESISAHEERVRPRSCARSATHREWTQEVHRASTTWCATRGLPSESRLGMVPRLNPRDIKGIAVDRNVPEPVRKQAQKFVKAASRARAALGLSMADYYQLLGVTPAGFGRRRSARPTRKLARTSTPIASRTPRRSSRRSARSSGPDHGLQHARSNRRAARSTTRLAEKPVPTTPEEIATDAYERALQAALEAGPAAGRGRRCCTRRFTTAPRQLAYQLALGRALARRRGHRRRPRGHPDPGARDPALPEPRDCLRRAGDSACRARACSCARSGRWKRRCGSRPRDCPGANRLAGRAGACRAAVNGLRIKIADQRRQRRGAQAQGQRGQPCA